MNKIIGNGVEYTILKKIGKGAFGEVYSAVTPDGREIALKISLLTEKSRLSLTDEITILKHIKCSHPNATCYIDSFTNSDNIFIVTELINGELSKYDIVSLPLQDKLEICKQISIGCQYLNSLGILHLDIKPTNIIITKFPLRAVIIDVGLSCFIIKSEPACDTNYSFRGSLLFVSPEMFQKLPLTSATDIYSLGYLFIYYITNGRTRMDYMTFNDTMKTDLMKTFKMLITNQLLYKSLLEKIKLDLLKYTSHKITDLIIAMIQIDQTSRPTYDIIISVLNTEISISRYSLQKLD